MNAAGSSSSGGPQHLKQQLSAESKPIFQEGIFLILSRWSALRLAVENEWAGRGSRQLADQLFSDIFSWFTQSKGELTRSNSVPKFLLFLLCVCVSV